MSDAEQVIQYPAGHWEDEAHGGDADDDHYQTFNVDEDHVSYLSPEKKQFKSDEVHSPDVISLTQFLSKPPPPNKQLMMKTIRKKQLICGMNRGLGMPRWLNAKNLLFLQGVVFLPLQKSGKGRGK